MQYLCGGFQQIHKNYVQKKMEKGKCNYPSQVVLDDGTEIRLVPLNLTGGRALYITKDGHGYATSQRNPSLHEIKATPGGNVRKSSYKYPIFRHFGNIRAHRAVLEAWGKPRPSIEYEVDHINGNHNDNRLENLEWVTHAENIHRRWVLNHSKGLSYHGRKLTELGKEYVRMHIEYAKKHSISLVDMVIEFDGEPIN